MEKIVKNVADGCAFAEEVGFPIRVVPHFTLDGRGSGLANNAPELSALLSKGLSLSPPSEVSLASVGAE